MKRFFAVLFLTMLVGAAAEASPLHSSERAYRGAFNILAAGRVRAADAVYWTELKMSNRSDHTVFIRLEYYSTSGYHEIQLANPLPPTIASYLKWNSLQADSELAPLGEGTMGAIRVVAVTSNGAEDPTAEIYGHGRIWKDLDGGGRLTEYVPGLTDYEASGGLRQAIDATGSDLALFAGLDVHNARMNVAFVNFDTEHEATFSIGERTVHDDFGAIGHADGVTVVVPPGSTRQVPLPPLVASGGSQSPIPFDPVVSQFLSAARTAGNGHWAVYVSIIDNITSSSTLVMDARTEAER